MSLRAARLCACGLLCAAVGCPAPPAPSPRTASRAPAVQSYTDSAAVTSLLTLPPYLVVGTTAGLDRYDPDSGARVNLTTLPILALAPHIDGQRLWAATATGLLLARPDQGPQGGVMFEASSPAFAGAVAGTRALVPDASGGVWVGTTAGLFLVDASGTWHHGGYTAKIEAIHRAPDGTLYLGTPLGLVLRRPDGSYEKLDREDGCTLRRVGFIVPGPDGAPVAGGEDDDGRPSLVMGIGSRFVTFRASPEVRFWGAARHRDELILATPHRFYALSPKPNEKRGGLTLAAVTGTETMSYFMRPLDLALPAEPRALAAASGELFVGSRTVGTARFRLGQRREPSWLRRNDLFGAGMRMSVACSTPNACLLAAQDLWRWDGEGFVPVLVGNRPSVILAVALDPSGRPLVLYRQGEGPVLWAATYVDGNLVPVGSFQLDVPDTVVGLVFAKFAPDGTLWLGLVSGRGPYGIAKVDLAQGSTQHHREGDLRPGVLPIPRDVTGIAFASTDLWLATGAGAVRIHPDGMLDMFTEAEGLESELLRAVAAAQKDEVWVASSQGVGVFNGMGWEFPRALAVDARALVLDPVGRLWVGTDQGLWIFDQRELRPVPGLPPDEVAELTADGFGRVWARTPEVLAILTP